MLALLLGSTPVWAQAGAQPSSTSPSQPSATEAEVVTVPMTVEEVDRRHRALAVRTADGERMTIAVPSDVKGFNKLKKGDKIDVQHYRAVAVSLVPTTVPGAESQKEEGAPSTADPLPTGKPDGRQISQQAEIVSVNENGNSLQVKNASGKQQTVSVQDPSLQKKAQSLHRGDAVQITYAEAVAVGIRPRK
jgi:hypothetical protein